MRALKLGSPNNTTPDAKFDWLIRSMRHVQDVSQRTYVDAYAFAKLPSTPVTGQMAVVTDSNTVTWGATVAGGGANKVLAWYNGANWKLVGA